MWLPGISLDPGQVNWGKEAGLSLAPILPSALSPQCGMIQWPDCFQGHSEQLKATPSSRAPTYLLNVIPFTAIPLGPPCPLPEGSPGPASRGTKPSPPGPALTQDRTAGSGGQRSAGASPLSPMRAGSASGNRLEPTPAGAGHRGYGAWPDPTGRSWPELAD